MSDAPRKLGPVRIEPATWDKMDRALKTLGSGTTQRQFVERALLAEADRVLQASGDTAAA